MSKAQKRAQQAEFNRQLWAEAEGPKEPNYFLESRNVVPLRSEFKPPTVLLSRKGPVVQSKKPLNGALDGLDLNKEESSDDEEDLKQREREIEERKERTKKEREERQRKYEERRQELFGTNTHTPVNGKTQSGNSSPQSLTPPGSRSSTPSRGRGRGGRRGGVVGVQQGRPQRQQQSELYEPGYAPKPDSVFLQRRENAVTGPKSEELQQPMRLPKGPDGSGRGGFGFSARGGKQSSNTAAVESPS